MERETEGHLLAEIPNDIPKKETVRVFRVFSIRYTSKDIAIAQRHSSDRTAFPPKQVEAESTLTFDLFTAIAARS